MSTTIVQEGGHTEVHPASQAGFGEGKAEQYDAFRPSYAPEVVSHIRKALTGKEELNIVEIASGTGIFTRVLLAHPEWQSGVAEIRCVEPNEGMRDVFSRRVNDPRVSQLAGTFDDTSITDGWADLIVIATAFHWCLDREAAIKEFIRILKPDGVVCLLWNPEDRSTAPWMKQIYDALFPIHKSMADKGADHFAWRDLFDLPLYKENFTPSEDTTINYVERGSLESFTARCLTWSGISLLSDEEKESVKRQVKEIVEQGDGLVWIDKEKGIFEAPYACPIVIFRRISGTKQA